MIKYFKISKKESKMYRWEGDMRFHSYNDLSDCLIRNSNVDFNCLGQSYKRKRTTYIMRFEGFGIDIHILIEALKANNFKLEEIKV